MIRAKWDSNVVWKPRERERDNKEAWWGVRPLLTLRMFHREYLTGGGGERERKRDGEVYNNSILWKVIIKLTHSAILLQSGDLK